MRERPLMLRDLARPISSALVGPVTRPDPPVALRRLVPAAPLASVRRCAPWPSFWASAVLPVRSFDFVLLRLARFFFGELRLDEPASLSAMAIACLRLFTLAPLRPLSSSPFLNSCITRSVVA